MVSKNLENVFHFHASVMTNNVSNILVVILKLNIKYLLWLYSLYNIKKLLLFSLSEHLGILGLFHLYSKAAEIQ